MNSDVTLLCVLIRFCLKIIVVNVSSEIVSPVSRSGLCCCGRNLSVSRLVMIMRNVMFFSRLSASYVVFRFGKLLMKWLE